MAKVKTVFYCRSCGYQSAKWLGKCPSCQEWNTFDEEIVQKDEPKKGDWKQGVSIKSTSGKAKKISEVDYENMPRLLTPDEELNRVLGGGIVPGGLILIGGEPGIGKSTLMLQVGLLISQKKVLYVTGEESEVQVKMRADRLAVQSENFYILNETSTQNIFLQIDKIKPEIVIIDSIQTMTSNLLDSVAGSISQVKECSAEFLRYSKESNTPVFLVGHITKDGSLAGPKILEHMVDTVLQFEGDRHLSYRLLRTIKNRFGSTSELGIYEMLSDGLRQVSNPSEILISNKESGVTGVAIAATIEGNRPLLIEIQALVSPSSYASPQRSTTGYDLKRLNMMLAVLEKRCGFRISGQDVFLNIAGGLKVEDPSIDLAVCAAVISSFEEIPIDQNLVLSGEIGLGGEIRAVNRLENRIDEAEKLGFEEIIVSKYGKLQSKNKIKVEQVGKLSEVFSLLFG